MATLELDEVALQAAEERWRLRQLPGPILNGSVEVQLIGAAHPFMTDLDLGQDRARPIFADFSQHKPRQRCTKRTKLD